MKRGGGDADGDVGGVDADRPHVGDVGAFGRLAGTDTAAARTRERSDFCATLMRWSPSVART
jgi:hypothetical protein